MSKDLFSDYQAITTRDMVCDYLKKPSSKVFKVLKEIGEPKFDKLRVLLNLLYKY